MASVNLLELARFSIWSAKIRMEIERTIDGPLENYARNGIRALQKEGLFS
jgi:hypothetical protein